MTDDSKTTARRQARAEKKTAYLRGIFERHAGQFRAAGSQDPPAVARRAHIAIDEVLERDREKSADSADIRCRKGCDHCCRGPVEIWPHEAALLVETARASGIAIDKALLERQSRYTMDRWRDQPVVDRPCVFLDRDGACKVYEARPNVCRKLLVLSDPSLCDAAQYPLERVDRWISWEAEMMESAALEVFGAALMPVALLAVLNREGRD